MSERTRLHYPTVYVVHTEDKNRYKSVPDYTVYVGETKVAAARDHVENGLTKAEVMAMHGIASVTPLERWCREYRAGGPEALGPRPKGRPRGSKSKPKPEPTLEQELAEQVAYLKAKVAYLEKLRALRASKSRGAIAWKTTTARSRCGCWPTIFLSARRYGSSKSSPRPSDWRSPKVSPVCMRTRTTGRGASPSSGWTASSTDWCSTATCARMTSAAIVPGTMGALTRTCTRPSVILAICLTRTITWNCSVASPHWSHGRPPPCRRGDKRSCLLWACANGNWPTGRKSYCAADRSCHWDGGVAGGFGL